jgi:hypothetical protein
MFIVWGKKLVYRRLGHVADFCPICRSPKPFELMRVGSASHVYYISAGEGELLGHERTCQECGTAFGAEPTVYASVSKQALPMPELVRQTFPNIQQVLKDRLALEEKVQRSPMLLTPEERHALIRNPFLLLSPKVEKRFASTHLDKEIGFALVAAIALLVTGPALAHAVVSDSDEIVLMIFILLGISLVGWQIVASGSRFMNRSIVPVLAGSLRPLKPTEGELRAVLAELKLMGHKMAKKLNLVDLQLHLNSPGGAR